MVHRNIIKMLIEVGGKDLVMAKDNHGNTAPRPPRKSNSFCKLVTPIYSWENTTYDRN
jgi:hypothetical protein